MKKMLLWIDDIRNAPDDTWLVARTITSAINALVRFEFDEISIDHDISHQIFMGEISRPYPCPEDFSSICHFIGMKYFVDRPFSENIRIACPRIPPKITIHSANSVGAEKMKKILLDYGIESTFIKQNPANRLETII